jgi:hypothetical protein
MANSHKSLVTQIQADEKLLLANRRAMDKVQLQFQCKCAHRDSNGSFALAVPSGQNPKKSQYTGAPLYRCRVCKKELDISNISEEEFMKSLDVINRVCDLSKMYLDLRSEKDQETLKAFSKLQYRMNSMVPDAYKTIRKGGHKKKQGNNNPMSGMIEVSR